MAQACTVCTHPDAVLINEALIIEKVSNRSVAKQYGVDHNAVQRHRKHVPQLLVKASQAMEVAQADDLLDQVRDLQRRALSILDKAEAADELRTALAAIAQARGNLELLGKLAGELQQEGATNIQIALSAHPDFVRLRAAVVGALEEHPEARWAVAAALKEIE